MSLERSFRKVPPVRGRKNRSTGRGAGSAAEASANKRGGKRRCYERKNIQAWESESQEPGGKAGGSPDCKKGEERDKTTD